MLLIFALETVKFKWNNNLQRKSLSMHVCVCDTVRPLESNKLISM